MLAVPLFSVPYSPRGSCTRSKNISIIKYGGTKVPIRDKVQLCLMSEVSCLHQKMNGRHDHHPSVHARNNDQLSCEGEIKGLIEMGRKNPAQGVFENGS